MGVSGFGFLSGAGQTFGRYRVQRQLGAGAMADVFLAEMQSESGFSKWVALKLMHADLVRDSRFAQLFISEARLGGFLSHHNIVQVLDFGEEDGRIFMAMEFVDGPTLQRVLDHCRRDGLTIPPSVAVEIVSSICQGLEHAHTAKDLDGEPLNMVHRDLKPSNILLTCRGEVKIADFGVARASSNIIKTQAPGTFKGTLQYMSPQQAQGELGLDHRSDIFAVGLLFYELLTLRVVYDDGRMFELMRKVVEAETNIELERLPPPPLRDPIRLILARTLMHAPEARFQSCREMGRQIEAIAARRSGEPTLPEWMNQHGAFLPEAETAPSRTSSDTRDISSEKTAMISIEQRTPAPSPAEARSAAPRRIDNLSDPALLKETDPKVANRVPHHPSGAARLPGKKGSVNANLRNTVKTKAVRPSQAQGQDARGLPETAQGASPPRSPAGDVESLRPDEAGRPILAGPGAREPDPEFPQLWDGMKSQVLPASNQPLIGSQEAPGASQLGPPDSGGSSSTNLADRPNGLPAGFHQARGGDAWAWTGEIHGDAPLSGPGRNVTPNKRQAAPFSSWGEDSAGGANELHPGLIQPAREQGPQSSPGGASGSPGVSRAPASAATSGPGSSTGEEAPFSSQDAPGAWDDSTPLWAQELAVDGGGQRAPVSAPEGTAGPPPRASSKEGATSTGPKKARDDEDRRVSAPDRVRAKSSGNLLTFTVAAILLVVLVATFYKTGFVLVRRVVSGEDPTRVMATITSTPDSALISFPNGKTIGRTPIKQELDIDETSRSLTVFAKKAGYLPSGPLTQKVPLIGEVSVHVELEPDRAFLGGLRVVTAPAGARIEIDGVPRGRSPILVESLHSMERHEIVVELDGYQQARRRFDIEAGSEEDMFIALARDSSRSR